MNGGPAFKFNEAISLQVSCDTQGEVDRLWNALIVDGGQESACGWLKDKYGLSWQITPAMLLDAITDPDKAKVHRAMTSMMTMRKLDIATLKKAIAG
jgi:2-polyprenyl-6-hydroxyphenyl methylase/3-demethylubiquinone-9 3-methyltransferase